MTSQNNMILNHLKNIGSITRAEAYELYGITELNTRICNLRRAGHIISSKSRSGVSRLGRKVSFCEYTLVKEADTYENSKSSGNG